MLTGPHVVLGSCPYNVETGTTRASLAIRGKRFLRAPLNSDEISLLKAGASSDPVSFMALYRSDGRDEGVTSPLQMDAYLAVVVLQDMNAFTLRRNRKDIQIPACRSGTIGFQDLRHAYSSAKYPVHSFSFVLSTSFLNEIRPGKYGTTDLQESVSYLNRDETLLHLALSLLPSFSQSTPNRLYVDQVFLAASTYLVCKFGGQQQLDSRRGCLTPRQEKLAKEFLDANIQNNVSLEYVARLCSLSPAHFARLFRRTAGMTPYQWFVHRRLARAKHLLESTDEPLAEIGSVCGFSDQSHFTRTFSRTVGFSPGSWRRLQRR